MSETKTPEVNAGHYLLGKIEALELLSSAVAAMVAPAAADAVLARCAELRVRAPELGSFEQGFLSVEANVLKALQIAADAEKMRALTSNSPTQ